MAADTSTKVMTNGAYDDDDEDPSKLRPVDIEQDVREMERRKRVDAIMSSKLFREELERVVSDNLGGGGHAQGGHYPHGDGGVSGMLADMLNVRTTGGTFRSASSAVPINDIRGLENMGYPKHERQLRCKLASAHRLAEIFGWGAAPQSIHGHISLKVSDEHFLLNAFGMLHSEVTASSLVKVDLNGRVVDAGTTNFGGVNAPPAFALHSALHAARKEIKCVMRVRAPSVVAVSAMKCGLLPLSQESCLLGDVSCHSYQGSVVDAQERDSLAKDLGPKNKTMLLRNHGAVCCGETLEEAFYYAYYLVLACDTQLKMMPLGLDNLVTIDDATRRKVFESAQRGTLSQSELGGETESKKRVWGLGEVEFEALVRMLDSAGCRTGYMYKNPLVREEAAKLRDDVELPPSVSSLGYLLEEENLYKDGPLRALLSGYAKQHATRGTGRTKWMNSPNCYQRVEVLETGTPEPKKITKWVAEDSPSKSTPIKVESPNQFVPLGTSKKEFKKVQAAMKEGRRAGGITAGPESKVLEGATWEDRDAVDGRMSAGRVDYKVGAASMGIIQRDYQHNATVYKSVYAKNPFDNVSAEELAEYQRIVDMKSRGEYPISPGPDGEPKYIGGTTADHPVANTREQQQKHVTAISRFNTLPKAKKTSLMGEDGDRTGGEETDGNRTFSEGEGDTSRATDPDSSLSPKKKKKSGLRTPSFLKKKKKEKSSKKA